jgi:hypothetical protein
MAKRARELAVKERRERKRAKKAEAAALRAAEKDGAVDQEATAVPPQPDTSEEPPAASADEGSP